VTPAERLLAAADLLDKRASEATEGPWFYNSYSMVFSSPKMPPYDSWHPEDEGHTLERAGKCEPCGEWREPLCYPDGSVHWTWPRGHGCKHFEQDYDMSPEVAGVPSHHGDTAVRSRKADAEYIATMHPEVGKAQAAMLRVLGSVDHPEVRMGVSVHTQKVFDAALALADLLLAGGS
jgi:hypothetical protein